MTITRLSTNHGPLSFFWNNGNLRQLTLDGKELVRGISAPVRDQSWGTYSENEVSSSFHQDDNGWRASRSARLDGVPCQTTLEVSLSEKGPVIVIDLHFTLEAKGDFATNRAGFCILHPLRGVTGEPLDVTHSDQSQETLGFPETISPSQPVFDIARLSHSIGGTTIEFQFSGEVFEMEDQRNWSDASYKTYCRPLSLPLPIRLKPGETTRQSIRIVITPAVSNGQTQVTSPPPARLHLPQIKLAVEPHWLGKPSVETDGFIMRAGSSVNWTDAQMAELAKLLKDSNADLDLELVVDNPQRDTAHWAERLTTHDLTPSRVIALPASYLKSYQPNGPWPGAPAPEEAFNAAKQAFPKAHIGAGMLTYFTEFNRRPPDSNTASFVTYSTSAIVHSADTQSVFETLEALPQIFSSAATLAPDKPQLLGLVAIPMRSNPYGDSLLPPAKNADTSFNTMTQSDARHKNAVGAAFACAATMLAAQAGIESLCLGAPTGPFGLVNENGHPTPLAKTIAALRQLSGHALIYEQLDEHTHQLSNTKRTIIAKTHYDDPHVILRDGANEEIIR